MIRDTVLVTLRVTRYWFNFGLRYEDKQFLAIELVIVSLRAWLHWQAQASSLICKPLWLQPIVSVISMHRLF